ncbi:MAG: group II intron reverse transcriptase/maturase, partial [Gemmatimonadetes bacterium]|nr:group II intron reverse transcriptase/maturase [Gemmatimonadota bacterium]
GFRPGRSAHDAVRTLQGTARRGWINWIVEADVTSFFDSVDRTVLKKMLRVRIADGSLLRLIGKCLHVGVLDGASYYDPGMGTPQGSALSPLLGNVYLHYVLDRWFERQVKPRMRGRALLIRYADDFILGFERRDDAAEVLTALGKRLGRFGLRLQPEKTRLVLFARPPRRHRGKGPATFDFLGFTWSWRRTRRGGWTVACTTRRARRQRILRSVSRYCRSHRHDPVAVQHAALTRRLQGHYNYFGVNGNAHSLRGVGRQASRIWFRWLNRRSQKRSFTWERYNALLARYPLPPPRITVDIWGWAP